MTQEEMQKRIDYLIDRNDKKQEIIDKAIVWANKNQYYFPDTKDLLKILEGEE